MNLYALQEKEKKFQRLINCIDRMPAMPHVAQEAIEVIDNPRSTAKQVGEIITKDMILSGRILRIANSAFYGFPRQIKSVLDAIVILGFETVKNLTIAATVQKLFNKKMDGYGIKSGELWRHSIGCALCSEAVAQNLKLDTDEAFISGLMHDVGKIVLDRFMKEESQKVLELVIEKNFNFTSAERMTLGYDHAQIGSKIAIKWNLPVNIVKAIEYHHKPESLKKEPKIAAIVRLSDAICMMHGIGMGGDELVLERDQAILDILGISKEQAGDLMEQTGNQVAELVHQLE